jgi:hypothetical protein
LSALKPENQTALARSPPYTGKTSLALLLEQYMVANRFNKDSPAYTFETIRLSCLLRDQDEKFADFFERFYSQKFSTLMIGDNLDHPVLVIIDEAQKYYEEVDSILWNAIKSQPKNLYIVCLGVYGPQQAGSPARFAITFDLEMLKFTLNEFDAFFSVFFAGMLGFGQHQQLHDFISSITDRHPGLLKSIFKYMSQFKRWDSKLPVVDVFAKVRSQNFIDYLSTQVRYSISRRSLRSIHFMFIFILCY